MIESDELDHIILRRVLCLETDFFNANKTEKYGCHFNQNVVLNYFFFENHFIGHWYPERLKLVVVIIHEI